MYGVSFTTSSITATDYRSLVRVKHGDLDTVWNWDVVSVYVSHSHSARLEIQTNRVRDTNWDEQCLDLILLRQHNMSTIHWIYNRTLYLDTKSTTKTSLSDWNASLAHKFVWPFYIEAFNVVLNELKFHSVQKQLADRELKIVSSKA